MGFTFKELITIFCVIVYNYIVALYRVFFPRPRKSIKGNIALVTGAGHGIGRELALELSKLGAITVICDINKENVENVKSEISSTGAQVFSYVCDICRYDQVARLANEIRRDVGDVDILCNNAGILHGGWLLDLSEADIRRTFEVNTLAHFWTVKEFLPAMIKKKKGHIFNTVSMSAFSPTALLVDYSASKCASFGFCESLREELQMAGHRGIQISAFCPYFVSSGLVEFYDKLDKSLGPHETAMIGIDGLLRNQQLIISPRSMWASTRIPALFPRQTNQFLKKMAGAGIHEKYSKKK